MIGNPRDVLTNLYGRNTDKLVKVRPMASFSSSNTYCVQVAVTRRWTIVKRFAAISFAVLSVIVAATIIVKSNQRSDGDAEYLMKMLTPDVLVERCGQPTIDLAPSSTPTHRQMYYAVSRDNSIGLIFSFLKSPSKPNWTYSSFHLGTRKGKGFAKMDDTEGSQTWAIVELPCLSPNR